VHDVAKGVVEHQHFFLVKDDRRRIRQDHGDAGATAEGGVLKVESSMQATGTLVGIEVTNIATIWSVRRPDGTLYIDGQGVVMARDGGTANFVGWGFGRLTATGGVSHRGAINCRSATGSLARLNSTIIPFEAQVDADQNIR
jgi:hypothetical protein